MCKRFILGVFVVIMLFSMSCKKVTPPTDEKKPITETVGEYFPFKENVKMKYAGLGNEFAEKETYVDFIRNNRMQLRAINPGTTAVEIYEISNGELKLIESIGEFYYREDVTSISKENPEILLKEPLEKGTSWNTSEGKRFISGKEVEVSTPSGKYKAIEVTTEGKNYTLLDYYVKNIGHVKKVYKGKDYTVETSLENLEINGTLTQNIKFYYPDFTRDKIVFTSVAVPLKTNMDIKDVFEDKLKNPPAKDLSAPLSKNAKINSLHFDRDKNILKADFSKELVTEMNAGTSLEFMILQSITNTLGDYYGTSEVFIAIDGKPYSSGHIQLNENEPLKVNHKNIFEYK